MNAGARNAVAKSEPELLLRSDGRLRDWRSRGPTVRLRSNRYTSQKAFRFSVDQAFDYHVFALDRGKIVIGKNRTAPGKCFDWQSRSFCLFLVPANTCDWRLGME